ncbi:hypothetical protein M23134_06121 [Microscilla marina ATCC 23134]|uniref:Uncharacterized protein n=1 Tax=Microscilla marina ATCC 23134 TaxID=313606 RepID=A1ZSL4_MICM2|nr:hypothetical protein M23134_06121 [Microscilla marina ATCC 23134]
MHFYLCEKKAPIKNEIPGLPILVVSHSLHQQVWVPKGLLLFISL